MRHTLIAPIKTSHGGLEKILPVREVEVLRICWRRGAVTVQDVYDEIRVSRDVAYTTVLTTCTRMAEKGLLQRERLRRERSYVYAPIPERDFVTYVIDQVLGCLAHEYPNIVAEYLRQTAR